MSWSIEPVRAFLLPGDAEADEGFRQEILRVANGGLRQIGLATIGATVFITLARLVVSPEPETLRLRLMTSLMMCVLGLLCVALARLPKLYEYGRRLAILAGWTIGALMIWSALHLFEFKPAAEDFIPGQITLIMLIGIGSTPLKPAHSFGFGAGLTIIYSLLAWEADRTYAPGHGPEPTYLLFITLLTLLGTVLSGSLYEQRRAAYQAWLQAIQSGQELRDTQARLAQSESAASTARLAAALSHELNNPLGALVSSIDTLLLLSGRICGAPAEDQTRLMKLQGDLRKSIRTSADRLKETAARLARFTNLDRAERQYVDLNLLLKDVIALVEPALKSGQRMETDFHDLPQVACHPHHLSGAFFDLLSNAVGALPENGKGGKVMLTTRRDSRGVLVLIEDSGHGLDSQSLAHIFDPSFRESGGRMAAGNWSMFNARQVVREHRGDIRIASEPGQGTRISVVLPEGSIT
jgi:signal transduction histidine kinase